GLLLRLQEVVALANVHRARDLDLPGVLRGLWWLRPVGRGDDVLGSHPVQPAIPDRERDQQAATVWTGGEVDRLRGEQRARAGGGRAVGGIPVLARTGA